MDSTADDGSRQAPLQVLQVIKGLGPGGAERLVVSMAAVAGGDIDYQVAYLLKEKSHLVAELADLGVPTHLIGGGQGMRDPRWLLQLRDLSKQFDVIHFHSPAVAAIARPILALRKRHPILVSTEHNVWSSHRPTTRVANAVTLPLESQRWAVSQEVISSMWPPWRSKSEVLHYGVRVALGMSRRGERQVVRQEHQWHDDDIVVLTVANYRHHKDYPTLFAAAAEALTRQPRLRFVTIGQGPLGVELATELSTYPTEMQQRFTMLGYHPDPTAVAVGADIFALSSVHEGLPIALLEAMTCGLAPVVTDVGGIGEVIVDRENGYLVEPGNPAALADALTKLADDHHERERISNNALRRSHDFAIETTADIVRDRYRELVDEQWPRRQRSN